MVWEEPDDERSKSSTRSRRDIFEDFESMHKKMFETFFIPMRTHLEETIPVNLSETEKELIVRAELLGFKKDEIAVNVKENSIEIYAEKKREEIERGEKFYRREAARKQVHRAFTLPFQIDPNKVTAKLEEGILIITMQKLKPIEVKKKKVEIK